AQNLVNNPEGNFQLFRVGDAVASRNVHSAIYDSLRLCKDL
ncbi:MAG: NADH-dependent oxidase, partial [SAR324 cluster bacterium]